ncbi:MAG TPA: transglutaminase domain-containing protein [Egibacteraceae bacterium]
MTLTLDPAATLAPSDVIDSDHPEVVATARRVVGDATAEADRAARLFTWVRDEIRYDMAPDLAARADWAASATLQRGYGFCQQKAVALAALLRAVGIPAGLAFQDLLDHKIPAHYVAFLGSQRMVVHGLTVARVDGVWQRLDAALDSGLCDRKGYRVVTYQPGRDCLLPATDRAGAPHFEVLEELGTHPDLPDEIVTRTLGLSYLHDPDYQRMARRHGPHP